MFNPCKDYCHTRLGKEYSEECNTKCDYAKVVQEKKIMEEEVNQPVQTLKELATHFCNIMECKNCPVMIHDYEKRTNYQKQELHEPCCTNLFEWILDEALKQQKE